MSEKLQWIQLILAIAPVLVLFLVRVVWSRQTGLKDEIAALGKERIQSIEDGCAKMQVRYDDELLRVNKRVDDILRNRAQ